MLRFEIDHRLGVDSSEPGRTGVPTVIKVATLRADAPLGHPESPFIGRRPHPDGAGSILRPNQQEARMRRSSGFTLIELMITVAIIAILSAIAVPAYNEYITRSRITEGLSLMSNMRVKMEQYFQDNRTYANACVAPSIATPPTGKYFTVTCPATGASTYTLRADGTGTMAGFAYTLNETNTQTTAGVPAGWTSAASCWVVKKNGECLQ